MKGIGLLIVQENKVKGDKDYSSAGRVLEGHRSILLHMLGKRTSNDRIR